MDEKRTKSLEALATFVESQKALFERTQSDIKRLKELRREISSLPENSADRISAKLDPGLFRLSELPGLVPSIDRDIEWTLFKTNDAAPLRELAIRARDSYTQSRQPSAKQQSALSPLQQLVKDYRANVLDPTLASIPLPSDSPSESDDNAPDPEEQKRARERAKIHELKKRRISGREPAPVFSGLGPRASNGVFVRRDQEDESAEVDIALDDMRSTDVLGSGSEVPMEVDTPPTSISFASPASVLSCLSPSLPIAPDKPVRDRRPSRKAQESSGAISSRGITSNAKSRAKPEPELPAQDSKIKIKPKSETYKQAWSVSEQHLLERLLEEIPEGEKNRWSKISQAMNGRRTARQVASRVQKYYEKLKRFGLDVGGNKSTD